MDTTWRLQPDFGQRLIDAGLVGSERAASLEQAMQATGAREKGASGMEGCE